jgi:hypothetical protein
MSTAKKELISSFEILRNIDKGKIKPAVKIDTNTARSVYQA